MKIGHSGKYFESQFVKSFHYLFHSSEYYIIRLKDNGSRQKQADVGDYLVFYKDVVFNVELKAREKGILYKSSLDENQVNKWKSFEYLNKRIPLIALKNTNTKEVGFFLKNEFIPKYEIEKIIETDANIKTGFNSAKIPYKLDDVFLVLYNKVVNSL